MVEGEAWYYQWALEAVMAETQVAADYNVTQWRQVTAQEWEESMQEPQQNGFLTRKV